MRLLLVLLLSTLALPAAPPKPEECIDCHDKIDLQAFRKRTHGGLDCTRCHTAVTEIPHPEKMPPVACVRCHDHEAQDYARSVHGVARKEGKAHAATCANCHGPAHQIVPRTNPASRVARKRMAETCGACHGKGWLDKLSTHIPSRGSHMDVAPLPKK